MFLMKNGKPILKLIDFGGMVNLKKEDPNSS